MKNIILILCFILMLSNQLFSQSTFYWVNRSGDGLWSTASNWDDGLGGSGPPILGDYVFFDPTWPDPCVGCSIDSDCNIDDLTTNGSPFGIYLVNGYSKTVTLGVGIAPTNAINELQISSGTFVQGANAMNISTTALYDAVFTVDGGTFTGGSSAISVNGTLTFSSGSFQSTSGTLTVRRAFSVSDPDFTHNSGVIVFNVNGGVTSQSISGTFVANKLTLATPSSASSSYTFTLDNTITVESDLTITTQAGAANTRNITINGGTIDHTGTIFNITGNSTSTSGGGTTNIKLTGTTTISGRTNSTYSPMPNIDIAGSTRTITVTSGQFLHVHGDLSTSGSGNLTINTGTINCMGNITIDNTGTGGGGNATIISEPTGTKAITGNRPIGEGRLPKLTINSSGTVNLAGNISVANDFTYTAGTVSAGTSVLAFYGTANVDGQGASTMTFNDVEFNSCAVTLAGNLDVNGDLTIGGGTLAASTFTITNAGNWTNNGTFTANSSTVTFDGATGQYITGTNDAIQTFNNLTISGGTKLRLRPRVPVTVSGTLLVNAGTDSLSVLASASGSTVNTGSLLIGGTFTNNGMIGFRTAILKNQWHCISSPVATAAVGTIFSDVPNGNFFYYDETVSSGFWTTYTSGNMTVGKGYYTYYYSNKFKNLVGGSFNNADPAPSLTYTPAGRGGFNEVGNPYPCALDVKSSNMDASFASANNTIYVKNGANWATYNRSTDATTYSGSRYVLPTQGFFVVATSATTFNMPLNARAHNTSASLLKSINSIPSLNLTCFSDSLSSENIVMFIDDATENFDGAYDAYKLYSDNVNTPELYTTTSAADTLVVDVLPLFSEDLVKPLGLKTNAPGTYTINAREIVNFDPFVVVFLEDVTTGIITNLNTDSSYTFNVTEAFFNSNSRFNLRFVNTTPPEITEQPVSVVKCSGELASLSVTTNNLPNLSYQWYNTSGLITGANTNQYSISNVTLNDANEYYCVITNSYGTVQSANATIEVTEIISLSAQPTGTLLCDGNEIMLSVTANGSNPSYQWQKDNIDILDATNAILNIADAGIQESGNYICIISNSCGIVFSDVAVMSVNPNPVVNLGSNQTVCEGTIVTLDAGNSGASYLWNDLSTNQLINPSTTGTYSVDVTKDGCTSNASVDITVNPYPVVNLGSHQSVCEGTIVILDAGNIGATYLWSDLSTNQLINLSSSGTYSVSVTKDGCTSTASVDITVNPNPVVNLGLNQTVCEGTIVIIDAGNPGASYLWNDLSTNQLINSSTSGTYSVAVTKDGCTSNASVDITMIPNPVVNLGNDISVCAGTLVTLNAGNNGTSYLWNDNSTNQQFITSVSGTFSVAVTKNGCTSDDEINVTVNSFPVVNLGNNQTVCEGTPVVLDAGNPGLTYSWSDGSTLQQMNVTTGDIYEVTVTNNGCSSSDYVFINFKPTPVVDLGSDISSCENDIITLDAGYITGNAYTWSNGSHNQMISTGITGAYAVTVTNNGCIGTDEVNVNINQNPLVDLGPDVAICSGCTETLDAGNLGATYLWSTNETTQTIDVTVAGNYSVIVTSSDGCTNVDEIIVDIVSGIVTNSIINNIEIYPNPVINNFTITTGIIGIYNIYVIDITGKVVLSIETDKNQNLLDISNLENGVYLIRVSNTESQFTNTLIKQ